MLSGGAAINVFARHVGADLAVVDMGVNHDFPDHPVLVKRKVAKGTGNIAAGPAMSENEAIGPSWPVRHWLQRLMLKGTISWARVKWELPTQRLPQLCIQFFSGFRLMVLPDGGQELMMNAFSIKKRS